MATTINPVNIVFGYDGTKLKTGMEASRAEINSLKRTMSSLVPDSELFNREIEVLDKNFKQLGLDTRGYMAVAEALAAKYGQETNAVKRLREETEKLAAAEKARSTAIANVYNSISNPGATSKINANAEAEQAAMRRRQEYDEKARERARANDRAAESAAEAAMRRRNEYDEKARERARVNDLENERLKTEAMRRRQDYDAKARERASRSDQENEQLKTDAMRRRIEYDEKARERARAADLETERLKTEAARRRIEYDEKARERARASDAAREQAALAAMRRRNEYDEQARERARANAQAAQNKPSAGSAFKNAVLGVGGPTASSYASLGVFGLTGLAIAKSVSLASEVEQAAAAYEVLAGSASKANAIVDEMRALDAKSILNLGDITQAGKILMGYQISADKVMPTLRKLGDISMGNADKFRSLSLAFGQVNAAGRLMGQETLQFINAGFNPLQQIAKDTGRSMPELKKAMEEGKISFEMVAEAILNATTQGGLFNGMLEKMSTTTEGKWQMMTGAFKRAGIEVGQQIKAATDLGMEIGTATGGFLEEAAKDIGILGTMLKHSFLAATGGLDDLLRTQRAEMADKTNEKNREAALKRGTDLIEANKKYDAEVKYMEDELIREQEEQRVKDLANAQLISDIREKDYEFMDEAYERQMKDQQTALDARKKLEEDIAKFAMQNDPMTQLLADIIEINRLKAGGLDPLIADKAAGDLAMKAAEDELKDNKYGAVSAQAGSRGQWDLMVDKQKKQSQNAEKQLKAAEKMIQILDMINKKPAGAVLANARGQI